MNAPDRAQNPARAMGARIRVAREAAQLTQKQLSDSLGFSDRQTLSAIETGDRRVQATELVTLSQLLGRGIEWFIDPFVVAGEAKFSWRVSQAVPNDKLDEFESYVGKLVGLLRHLRIAIQGPSKALSPTLRLPLNSTYEEAWSCGEAVAQELDLGLAPSHCLIDRIESRLSISVLFVDAEGGPNGASISGAMCRMPDLGVIVINRREPLVRRNFDVAHELFHALTWDALTPERREDPDAKPIIRGKRMEQRIEQLADNFAAAVLMPKASLTKLIDPAGFVDPQHLASVASELQVSNSALAYRLFNLKMIDKPTRDALCAMASGVHNTTPKTLSTSFVALLHDGIVRGHVSARKAAKALSMTLEQLATLMQEHDKTVPFSV